MRQQTEEGGAGSATSANIVFTTESGRILVNGGVYKGIKLNPVSILPYCSRSVFAQVGTQIRMRGTWHATKESRADILFLQ